MSKNVCKITYITRKTQNKNQTNPIIPKPEKNPEKSETPHQKTDNPKTLNPNSPKTQKNLKYKTRNPNIQKGRFSTLLYQNLQLRIVPKCMQS